MNIIEIQDQLRTLPKQQLMQEMQQPTGMAPQFLVLSELERRNKMEQAYQAQQQPQPSVAEQALMQGLGSMQPQMQQPMPQESANAPSPVPGMYIGGLIRGGYQVGKNILGKIGDFGMKRPFSTGLGITGLGFAMDDEEEDPRIKALMDQGMTREEAVEALMQAAMEQQAPQTAATGPATGGFTKEYLEGIRGLRDQAKFDKKDALNQFMIDAGLGLAGSKESSLTKALVDAGTAGIGGLRGRLDAAKQAQGNYLKAIAPLAQAEIKAGTSKKATISDLVKAEKNIVDQLTSDPFSMSDEEKQMLRQQLQMIRQKLFSLMGISANTAIGGGIRQQLGV